MNQAHLTLRKDDFSTQATLEGDSFLFFRRLADPDAHVFTDLNPGRLDVEQAARYLSDFVRATGGWPQRTLFFDAIGYRDDAEETLRISQDQVLDLIGRARKDLPIRTCARKAIRQKLFLEIQF